MFLSLWQLIGLLSDVKDPYMPFYTGDYLRATMTLSTTEHGAYFLLLVEYWEKKKALPDVDKELALVVRQTVTAWKRIRPNIARLFEIRDGKWFNKRMEEELVKRESRSKKAFEASQRRW